MADHNHENVVSRQEKLSHAEDSLDGLWRLSVTMASLRAEMVAMKTHCPLDMDQAVKAVDSQATILEGTDGGADDEAEAEAG